MTPVGETAQTRHTRFTPTNSSTAIRAIGWRPVESTERTIETLIRDAADSDAAACAEIYAPYVDETVISFEEVAPSANEMWRRMSEAIADHAWLVAERGGVVVGYAYAHAFASRPAYRWAAETSIYLDRKHRGRGLGRELYVALLDRLAEQGYRRAFGGITLPNDASVGLHRSMGFDPCGVYHRVGWKFGSWHDVAWFQRDLGDPTAPPAELG